VGNSRDHNWGIPVIVDNGPVNGAELTPPIHGASMKLVLTSARE
jgi:hypothetical protein